jgi:hypothetical protein
MLLSNSSFQKFDNPYEDFLHRKFVNKWKFLPVPTLYLKVLTNEKRGGLKLVAFDRSPFSYSR